jgi:type IV pilus assembly protein PilE
MTTKGFSLIELMLVLIIVGIFINITYPSYRDAITRARRSDGQTALVELANRLEDYYSLHHTYQNATLGTGKDTDVLSSKNSSQNWYTLIIAMQTEANFIIHAVPRNAQAINDKSCQTLTVNNFGVKGIIPGPSGAPIGTIAQCWYHSV